MATDNNDKLKKISGAKDAKVVKVAPYPINCFFDTTEGKPPLDCLIQRLEDFGYLFKSRGHFYRPGEEYTCNFEIPGSKIFVRELVKVIKTSESAESYVPNGTKEKIMLVEVHFKNQFGEHRKGIREFIKKIGQKPPQAPPVPPKV